MAFFHLMTNDRLPVGTSIDVYEGDPPPPGGSPTGTPVQAGQVMQQDGLLLVALDADKQHYAWATVNGQQVAVKFLPGRVPTGPPVPAATNVAEYGLLPDQDNSGPLADLMNDVNPTALEFGPGEWNWKQVTFPNNMLIRGVGYGTDFRPTPGYSMIELTGGGAQDWAKFENFRITTTADHGYDVPILKCVNARGVSLDGLTVNMSGTGLAMFFGNSYLFRMNGCYFRTNAYGVPFEIAQSPVGQTIDTFTFTNVVMIGVNGPIFRGPPPAFTTTLAAPAQPGQRVLVLSSAGLLGPGMTLTIGAEVFTTSSVAGPAVKIPTDLVGTYAAGTTVTISAVAGGNTHGISGRGFKRVYAGASADTNPDWAAVRYKGTLASTVLAGVSAVTAATGTGAKYTPGDPVKLDDTVNQEWAAVAGRVGDTLTLGTVDRTRQPVALIGANAHATDTTLTLQTGMGKRFFAGDRVIISDGTNTETFTLAVDGNATTDVVTLPSGLAHDYPVSAAWLVASTAYTLANGFASGTNLYNQSIIESTVASFTTNTITVHTGDGQYFSIGRPVCYGIGANFGVNVIDGIAGDVLTLRQKIIYPPNAADPVIQSGYGVAMNTMDDVTLTEGLHIEGPQVGLLVRGGTNWKVRGIASCGEVVRPYSSLTDPEVGPFTWFGNHNGDLNASLRVPEGNWPNPVRPVIKQSQAVFGTLAPFQPYWGPPNVKYEIHDVTQPAGGVLNRVIRNFVADGASNVDDTSRFELNRLNGKDAWSWFGSGKLRYATDPTSGAPVVMVEVGAGVTRQVIACTLGDPNTQLTGRKSALALALGGAAPFNLLYVKTTDTGNTGWLALVPMRTATAARTPGTIGANSSWPGGSITVTGAKVGDTARLSVDGTLPTGLIPYAVVTAADTVVPYIANVTTGGLTVASGGAVNCRVIVDATQ